MSPFEVLVDSGLMCWSTIYLGCRNGWMCRSDIFEYAIGQLVNGCDGENVAVIAGGEYLADDEILALVLKEAKASGSVDDLDKWRLAFLLTIELSGECDEHKLDKLQEVYAEFKYPEDMISCTVYSQDDIPPLVAMKQVVEKMKKRFQVR